MKNTKIKLFLIWIIILWSFTNNAFAEKETSAFCFKFKDWTIEKYYDKQNKNKKCPKNIIIPSKINWVNVVKIWKNSFSDKNITSVVIPNSVVKIWNFAFYDNEISFLAIPNSVLEIWDSAFENNKLKSLILPNSVNKIWNYAFSRNNLSSVIIPNSLIEISKNSFDKKVEIEKWEIEKPFNFLEFLKGLFNKFLGLFK